MAWHKFVLTKGFWFDDGRLSRESVVYSAFGVFLFASAVIVPLAFWAPILLGVWWFSFLAAMATLVIF
jgi:hypothetical protein